MLFPLRVSLEEDPSPEGFFRSWCSEPMGMPLRGKRLAKASPWVRYTSFGRTPQGRDLPLVILSKDRAFTPTEAAKTKKAIVLIQSGIHAGEIDGKDASLMLIRDIAITKNRAALLDRAIVLFVPIFNVDGHERFGKY